MIQDIAPRVFFNDFRSVEPQADDYVLYFENNKILLSRNDGHIKFLQWKELQGFFDKFVYLFSIDETSFFLVEGLDATCYGHYTLEDMSMLRTAEPQWAVFAALTANQLQRWYDSRRFCGHCGKSMTHKTSERAMECIDCQITEYPKIAPAVIIGVTNGDKLLLSKYANRPYGGYALLAGFAEVGESIEETVRREVWEEAGLKVRNITYYKSQPWAYSDSLLLGFFAELDGPEEITIDEKELAEAKWIPRNEIPPDHSGFSLTAEMIETFRRQHEQLHESS